VREGERCVNRLVWMRPDGTHEQYDKRHLFRMAGEHERYAGGNERIVVELAGWRICPLVCYDLRFPVYSRNRYNVEREGQLDFDLQIFVANWPAARAYAWKTLLRARAIENLCYVAAVNRVGVDGNGLEYSGDSAVIDFLGQPLIETTGEEGVVSSVISGAELAAHRERFPAMLDGDAFSLS
jgi:predicted amidohydrolase